MRAFVQLSRAVLHVFVCMYPHVEIFSEPLSHHFELYRNAILVALARSKHYLGIEPELPGLTSPASDSWSVQEGTILLPSSVVQRPIARVQTREIGFYPPEVEGRRRLPLSPFAVLTNGLPVPTNQTDQSLSPNRALYRPV